MMVINLTEITTINHFTDILPIVNNNTNHLLGVFILIMLFGASFLACYFRFGDPKDSFYGAMIISVFASLFMFAFNILPNFVFFVVVSAAAVTLALSYFRR